MKTSKQIMPSNEHETVVCACFSVQLPKIRAIEHVLQIRKDPPNFCLIIEYLSIFLNQSF